MARGTEPEAENPSARHETRDASVRSLVIFGVTLFLSLGAILLLMIKVFHYFAASQSLGPPASPFAQVRALPPQPRLQVEPRQDLEQLRADQDTVLNSYGWVDRQAGIVRIPIDRAMDLLIHRGLPVRSSTSNPSSGLRPATVEPYTAPKGHALTP